MDLTSAVHSDPYLDDGNVVLAARTVDGACHVFRVHRSLLCRQSGIFADMFAVAAPTDPSAHEMYAGASLVRMPDDAKDLGDLLKMMYDPSPFSLHRLNPLAPFVLEGALKLSTKYEIPPIRSRIVEHLQSAWPQTLAELGQQREAAEAMVKEHRRGDGEIDGLFLDDRLPEPVSAIRVARMYEVPKVLPAAYYALYCINSTRADWNECRGGGQANHNPWFLRGGNRTARWDMVDIVDMKRLVRLQEIMLNQYLEMKVAFIDLGSSMDDCKQPEKCTERRKDLESHLFEDGWHIGEDALARIKRWGRFFCEGMCVKCRPAFTRLMDEHSGIIWDSLPKCLEI